MKVQMTTKTYSKTESGKSWKKNPDDVEEKELSEEHYKNMISDDTCKFFRRLGGSETITRSYTYYGYLPVESISCNPDRSIRKVRVFKFDK